MSSTTNVCKDVTPKEAAKILTMMGFVPRFGGDKVWFNRMNSNKYHKKRLKNKATEYMPICMFGRIDGKTAEAFYSYSDRRLDITTSIE
jgi:hypothetical protein